MARDDRISARSRAEAILEGLNGPQAEAVAHGDGPVLVFAGAGSGKTRVLTHRIAYLMQVLGKPAWSIMAVTFTNKAANEMRERVLALTGSEGSQVTIGTFHSICARILRREWSEAGTSNFAIYDADDQRSVMKQALSEAQIGDPRLTPGVALSVVSKLKNELISPDRYVPSSYTEDLIAQVFPAYEELLRRNNALDFDDLLVKTVRLFESRPDVLDRYAGRYQHVLVDEYQDTNHVQYVLISLLASKHRNLFVVGDADQAIYGWRGADIRNILDFETQFPDARAITLEQNYRSTQNILDAAHHVISVNQERPPKRLWTDKHRGLLLRAFEARNQDEEAHFVAREIRRLIRRGSTDANSCAVMYRTNAQSRPIEDAFIREGVPYRIVGTTKFYERREIRDVLAYLRFAANPADSVSLSRIINVPPRKIGGTTVAHLNDWARQNGLTLWEGVRRSPEIEPLASAPRKHVEMVARLFEEILTFSAGHDVVYTLDHLLETTGYANWLQTLDDGEDRRANVEELRSVALNFAELEPEESLRHMLEHVSLVSEADEVDAQEGSATLMTTHLAKGLEFDVVFLVGMEEGIFPHSRALDDPEELEEERRLCYVGITRARRMVYMSYAMARTLMGRTHRNPPSRFLLNIPENLFSPESNLPRGASNAPQRYEEMPVEGKQPERFVARIDEQSFVAGEKVYHKHFGLGTVVDSTLDRGDEEVTVEFVANGRPVRKTLSVMYSGIQHA